MGTQPHTHVIHGIETTIGDIVHFHDKHGGVHAALIKNLHAEQKAFIPGTAPAPAPQEDAPIVADLHVFDKHGPSHTYTESVPHEAHAQEGGHYWKHTKQEDTTSLADKAGEQEKIQAPAKTVAPAATAEKPIKKEGRQGVGKE